MSSDFGVATGNGRPGKDAFSSAKRFSMHQLRNGPDTPGRCARLFLILASVAR